MEELQKKVKRLEADVERRSGPELSERKGVRDDRVSSASTHYICIIIIFEHANFVSVFTPPLGSIVIHCNCSIFDVNICSVFLPQSTKEEVVRWEEGKKWQNRMEAMRSKLKEKEKDVEVLTKQLGTMKELYSK